VGPVTPTLPPTLPGPSDAEYACCLAKVSTATNDWSSEEGKALAQTEPVANCCRALIAAVDIDGSRYRQVNPVRAACCTSNAVQGSELFLHRLCTPWGPPMPPALDWQAS
jgi:hypothetical protein